MAEPLWISALVAGTWTVAAALLAALVGRAVRLAELHDRRRTVAR